MPTRHAEGKVEQAAAVLQISKVFPWQSWFDSTLLQQAVAVQPAGTQIVQATESQYGGHSLILHKSSQTPIAVTARGDGGGAPTNYILVPGQSISPMGSRPFRSFTWGLPYGWMGGGMAQLLVTQQANEPTFGTNAPETPFHRARFAIKQPTDLTLTGSFNNSPLNWPIRFPWVQSSNQSGILQPGAPLVGLQPTRLTMVLRGLTTLAAPANMRVIIEGADDYCLDAGGVSGQLDQSGSIEGSFPIFDEFTWPIWSSIGTSGNLSVQNPELSIDGASTGGKALLRLGCSGIPYTTTAVGVTFVDDSGSGALSGCFVDIVRYGSL